MPGLLDFLNSDEAAIGLGLLAAGGPVSDPNQAGLGQRLAAATQYAQGNAANRTKQDFVRSQIAENASQAAVRDQQLKLMQRKQAMTEGLLGFGQNQTPSGGPAPNMGGGAAPAMGGGMGGAAPAGAGAGGPAALAESPVNTPRGPMTLAQISASYKIPFEALAFDLVNNDGKGIAEWVFKRGSPDMAVTDGFAYDKNKLQGGFLPAVTQSQDGKSTTRLIGPDGLPVVTPTPGAVGTFGAFQDASNASSARLTPQEYIDPVTQEKKIGNRLDVLRGGAPTQPAIGRAGTIGGGGGPVNGQAIANPLAARPGDDDRVMIFAAERRNAQQRLAEAQASRDPDAIARAQSDVDGLEKEIRSNRINLPPLGSAPLIGRMPAAGGGRGSQGMSMQPAAPAGDGAPIAELSPMTQARNEAEKVRMVKSAESDVKRDNDRQGAVKLSTQIQSVADQAQRLLDKKPTGSGIGSLVDAGLSFVGQPSESGTAASQLETLSGWLVSNVPRMEGPQSNVDVLNYQTMAGKVGDRTQTVEARKAALQTMLDLQKKYAELNGGDPGKPPPTGGAASAAGAASFRWNPSTKKLEAVK